MSEDEIVKRGLTETALRETLAGDMLAEVDVGIIVDEKEGLHEMPDYGAFVAAFKTGEPSSADVEVVASYLDDETTPAFVFRRARDKNPENYLRVMKKALALMRKPVGTADDFELTMDAFKPGWRDIYPSGHPLNEFFAKERYEDMGAERNDACPCDSGSKFKKCHGS